MDKFYRETLDREEMGDYFLRQVRPVINQGTQKCVYVYLNK